MKTQILLIITALTMLGAVSCKKGSNYSSLNDDQNKNNVINKINQFKPTEGEMGNVYYRFIAKKDLNMNNLKNDFLDQQIDSAIWNIETYLNTTYGFRSSDTCYKESEIIDTLTFAIKGFNNSIPLVDGEEIGNFLILNENNIIKENSDGDNIDFWCNFIDVIDISDGKVTITMNTVRSIRYFGVYPPGFNPQNFTHYTCMQAVGRAVCNGKNWGGANFEYERRIEIHDGSVFVSPGYIMVYDYAFYKGMYSPGVNGRLWHVNQYNRLDYNMSTSPPADELNTYLQSTKDVVDDFNPQGVSDRFLGNIYIYGATQNSNMPYTSYHMINFYIFKRVAVGLPG